MSGWNNSGPTVRLWPPDRFEVRCVRASPEFSSSDRYHYAKNAHEAVLRLRDAGLVTQLQAIRIEDGAVLFDLASGTSVPAEQW